MATKTIDSTKVQKYISGISYPASKQDLISLARSNDADNEIIEVLNSIPDIEYNSWAEVATQLDH